MKVATHCNRTTVETPVLETFKIQQDNAFNKKKSALQVSLTWSSWWGRKLPEISFNHDYSMPSARMPWLHWILHLFTDITLHLQIATDLRWKRFPESPSWKVFKKHLDVAPGNMAKRWSWCCWVDSWTRQSWRSLSTSMVFWLCDHQSVIFEKQGCNVNSVHNLFKIHKQDLFSSVFPILERKTNYYCLWLLI